jgi:hypothetical protein
MMSIVKLHFTTKSPMYVLETHSMHMIMPDVIQTHDVVFRIIL